MLKSPTDRKTQIQFIEASKNFETWLNVLNNATESRIPEAQKYLKEGIDDKDATGEQYAELALRDISERIDDVMSAFDKMLASMGFAKRYQRYFE